ncbi:MAG: radical SAM protein [Veillonella sp.]|nr:radical SAM protein [Veillonella sp.]
MKGSDCLQVQDILAKDLVGDEWLTEEELRFLMSVTDEEQLQLIYKKAYEVKVKYVKPVAYYRGLIEFSNRCIKNCNYCGIRRENDKAERFDMNREDIIKMAQWAYDHEYGSITLQSGERCDDAFVDYVVDLIRDIKAIGDGSLGITMCVGEQSEEAYRRMREAGASRYLLRIETTNTDLYHKIHPRDELHSFETRVECLRRLRRVGFQVGTGVMIGLPGQTEEDLVNDILFYRDMDIEFLKDVNIAATTALQALDKLGREKGLAAGANILMPIITIPEHRAKYLLYDNKPCVDDNAEQCKDCLTRRVMSIGDTVGWKQNGDSKHYGKRTGEF